MAAVALRVCAALAALLLAAAAPAPPAVAPIARADSWWQQRHADKLAEAHAHPVDLLLLGDSITQDYEGTGPPPYKDFRAVWQRFYGDRHALNLGFSGDATSHLLWRIGHGELDGLAPKAAVILIGANNLGRLHWPAADDVAGIEAVVAATHRHLPATKILLLGVLPSDRGDWVRHTTAAINAALAARYGGGQVPYLTYHDAGKLFMTGDKVNTALFYDPLEAPPRAALHPSPEGQALLAADIEPILSTWLGDRPHTR